MTKFIRKQIPRSHLRLWKDINGQNWVYGKQFGAVTEYTPLCVGGEGCFVQLDPFGRQCLDLSEGCHANRLGLNSVCISLSFIDIHNEMKVNIPLLMVPGWKF